MLLIHAWHQGRGPLYTSAEPYTVHVKKLHERHLVSPFTPLCPRASEMADAFEEFDEVAAPNAGPHADVYGCGNGGGEEPLPTKGGKGGTRSTPRAPWACRRDVARRVFGPQPRSRRLASVGAGAECRRC